MLRLSKMTDYAIVLLATMAGEPARIFATSELSGVTHLEQTTVAKVCKMLTKSGLIRSYRGANGGYRLAQAPDRIAVADIIAAMEGPIGMTECTVSPGLCTQEAYCRLQSNWRKISAAVENALAGITLKDMAVTAPPGGKMAKLRVVTEA